MNVKQLTAVFLALLCLGAGGTMALGLGNNAADNGQSQLPTTTETSASQSDVTTTANNGSGTETQAPSVSSADMTKGEIVKKAQRASQGIASAKMTIDTQATVKGKSVDVMTQVQYRKHGATTVKMSSPSINGNQLLKISDDGITYAAPSMNTAHTVPRAEMANSAAAQSASLTSMMSVQSLLQKADVSYQGTEMVNGQQAYVLCAQVSDFAAFEGTALEGSTTTVNVYMSAETHLPLKLETTTVEDGETITTTSSTFTYHVTKECEEPLAATMETPDMTQTQ